MGRRSAVSGQGWNEGACWKAEAQVGSDDMELLANRKGLGPFCRRDDIDGEEEITHFSSGRRFSCIAIVTAEGSERSNWYRKRQG